MNISSLPLSDYSRNYLLRMDIDYYLGIYRRCLRRMLRYLDMSPETVTLVDYGGGHGLLGVTAKQLGVGQVIYVDYNPQACDAVRVISDALGAGPDHILCGDSALLRQWCADNAVVPHALLGMDVIEHIYRLEPFFADLFAINPTMRMLFTTGSTPYNPRVVRRLHRIMQADEAKFYLQRRTHIASHYPQLKSVDLDTWASATRGLNLDDTLLAVETHTPFDPGDAYNTCDPVTSSWTERILPIAAYRRLLEPYGATLAIRNGYYNQTRRNLKGLLSRLPNLLLATNRLHALAPFIILEIAPAKKS